MKSKKSIMDPFMGVEIRNVKESDMAQILRDAEIRRQQEIADWESRSKPLYELVFSEYFTVDDVIAESYATSITPLSEMRLGGRSSHYPGGYISKLVLKVVPDNKEIPVSVLNFDGISVIRAGDYISAQIPRYEEKKVASGVRCGSHEHYTCLYLNRDFKPEESAIELAIHSVDRKVLRRDRSIDYD